MGRPIKKKWFGQASAPGGQIIVTGAKWADGTTIASPYIQSQTGDNAYMVQDLLKTHTPEILFMVNAAAIGSIGPSQMFVNATPFGGTALPAKKIQQYRITLFTTPYAGTPRATGVPTADAVANYTWSTVPATKAGQVDLITETTGTGIVNAIVPGAAGAGYFVAPTVTFPAGAGGGTGATARATLSATGTVAGYTLLSGGNGYTAGAVTVTAPPASVTATATGTMAGGIITGVTLVNGGGYYLTAPSVTIAGAPGTGATATASISGGKVVGLTLTAGGTGYVAPITVTIAAPPAAVAATATFTVTTVSGLLEAPSGDEEAAPEAESAKSSFRKSELKKDKEAAE